MDQRAISPGTASASAESLQIAKRIFTLFFRLSLLHIHRLAPAHSPTCFIIYGHDAKGQNKAWTEWLESHLTLAGIHLKTDRDSSKQAHGVGEGADYHRVIETIGRGTQSDIANFIWPGLPFQGKHQPLDFILVCASNALYDKYVNSATGQLPKVAVVYQELQALKARQESQTPYAASTVIFF